MSDQLARGENGLALRQRRALEESLEHEEDTSKSCMGLFCRCGLKFICKDSLSVHIRKFSAKGKFKCEICKQQFFAEELLQKHLQLKHEPKWEKHCSACGKSFPVGDFFRKHCQTAHPKVVQSPPVSKPVPPSLQQDDDSNDSIQFIGIFSDAESHNDGPQAPPSPTNFIFPKILNTFNKQNGLPTTNESAKQEHERPQVQASTSSAFLAVPIIKKAMITRSQVTRPAKERPPPPQQLSDVLADLGFTMPRTKQIPKANSSRVRALPKIFGCIICEKGYTRVYDLHRHLRNAHDGVYPEYFPVGCLQCNDYFAIAKDCRSHWATFHGPPIDLKPKLPLASSSRDSIAVPIVTIDQENDEYDEDNEYSVDKEYSPPLSLQQTMPIGLYNTQPYLHESLEGMNTPFDTFVDPHQVDMTKMDMGFYCTCGNKYASKKRVETHIRHETQVQQWNYQCSCCERIFPTKPQLKAHTKRSHKMLIVESEDKECGYVGCVFCELVFDTFDELQRHQEVIHKARDLRQEARSNFKKAARAKSRNRTSNLIDGDSPHYHVVYQGSDEHKFVCACGISFKNKSCLNKHIVVKLRGKVFRCLFCPKAFSEKYNLKVHAKTVHKINNQ